MTTAQIWNNIIAYALQIGLMVGLGALVPPLLKLRTPRARLLFWQTVLIACIVLPWVQPWRQEVVSFVHRELSRHRRSTRPLSAAPSLTVVAATASSTRHSIARTIPFTAILLWLLAAGVMVRI